MLVLGFAACAAPTEQGVAGQGLGQQDLEQAGCELQAPALLERGQTLSSCDGRFVFAMQTDGNAVLYQNNAPLWATGTHNTGAKRLAIQEDGNLVLYGDAPGEVYWHSSTYLDVQATPGRAKLVMQNDGNLVQYWTDAAGETAGQTRALWNTGTYAGSRLERVVDMNLGRRAYAEFLGDKDYPLAEMLHYIYTVQKRKGDKRWPTFRHMLATNKTLGIDKLNERFPDFHGAAVSALAVIYGFGSEQARKGSRKTIEANLALVIDAHQRGLNTLTSGPEDLEYFRANAADLNINPQQHATFLGTLDPHPGATAATKLAPPTGTSVAEFIAEPGKAPVARKLMSTWVKSAVKSDAFVPSSWEAEIFSLQVSAQQQLQMMNVKANMVTSSMNSLQSAARAIRID